MMDNCAIFVNGIGGLDEIRLNVPVSSTVGDLKSQIYDRLPESIIDRIVISTSGGLNISKFKNVDELYTATSSGIISDTSKFINLRLSACLCGGKGGFGTLLKQRAKKNSKKNRNSSKDLYKTLDGRRVKDVKKLKKLETYIDQLDEAEKLKMKEKRDKLEKILSMDIEKNVKYDDMEYLEDVEKQIEEIRNVVNYDSDSESDSDISSESDTDSDTDTEEKPRSSKTSKVDSFFQQSEEISKSS